jgi:formylglycine-generating enzyme required for sulfatase activity
MPPPTWIGQTIGGRYRIDALLGQGGMSAVYKGIDPNLRRTVAIKLIHAHLATDREFVRRFEEEAAAVAGLRHPHIIQVFDFNHDEGTYFMVLEFVEGETLFNRLQRLHITGQRIPPDEVLSLMSTICEAVQYAHERGLVHRDLKPANVMLTPSGQPILMDFGVAKIVGMTRHTATGAVVGTPTYISPEQVRGQDIDHRADIYALGVMLFEMVTGRVPFDADTALSLMLKHINDPVPDARAFNPDVPARLVAIIQKALAKQPEERYQSARDLGLALRQLKLGPEKQGAGAPQTIPIPAPGTLSAASGVRGQAGAPVRAPGTPPPSSAGTRVFAESGGTRVERPRSRSLVPILIAIGALAALVFIVVVAAGLVGGWLYFGGGQATDVAVVTEPRTTVPVGLTQEGTPSGTLPAATTPAPVAVVTETVPAETPTPIPVPPGKALIPAGFFQMGSAVGGADEAPEHPVLMPAFYLDLTEVTNAMYRQCVGSGACTPSGSARQNNSTFDNYPVVQVIWGQADTYCRSVGGRLPTEAEWEYAAGGPENLTWPWGNTFDPLLSAASRGDVQPVGSFAGGASPFKVLDMAGNANEWVADAYSTTFYAASPASSPLNSQGGEHIYRGGSFDNSDGSFYTTSRRYHAPAGFNDVDIGFRCAQDAALVNETTPPDQHKALVDEFCALYAAYKPGAACP